MSGEQSLPDAEAVCRHCLQILIAETIKIWTFRTIHPDSWRGWATFYGGLSNTLIPCLALPAYPSYMYGCTFRHCDVEYSGMCRMFSKTTHVTYTPLTVTFDTESVAWDFSHCGIPHSLCSAEVQRWQGTFKDAWRCLTLCSAIWKCVTCQDCRMAHCPAVERLLGDKHYDGRARSNGTIFNSFGDYSGFSLPLACRQSPMPGSNCVSGTAYPAHFLGVNPTFSSLVASLFLLVPSLFLSSISLSAKQWPTCPARRSGKTLNPTLTHSLT